MGTQPVPKKGAEPPPQFSAHFYCGQTAGCIKTLRGMEVGLSPGDFVLDKDRDPLPKRGPCLLWPNGCMDQDTTWYGDRPRTRQHCVTWGPTSPYGKERSSLPLFGPLLWPASLQACILPIAILSTRQCTAGGSRGNSTG